MKIAGICCVKDGAKYMTRLLIQYSNLCDQIFILDDRSSDNVKEICGRFPKVHYFRNDEEPFHGGRNWRDIYSKLELSNRWFDWVIGLDADELFEEGSEKKLYNLLEGTSKDVNAWSFPMLYLWNDEKHYRADTEWYKTVRAVRVFRYFKDKLPVNTPRHATSLPENIGKIANCDSINILHFGYMDKEDRIKKYNYYKNRDKDMIESGKDNYLHMLEHDISTKEIV